MTEYVAIKYNFQHELSKINPLPIGVFSSFENAESKTKQLHLNEWQRIIKEGIKSDTFDFYSEKLKAKGLKFSKDANQKEVMELVDFIETGKVETAYGTTDLKELRIIEIKKVNVHIENDSRKRFLIKEDELFYDGEVNVNPKDWNYGIPALITNNYETANSKIQEFEYSYLVDNVLRDVMEIPNYRKDSIYFKEDELNHFRIKLREKGVDLNNPIEMKIKDVKQVRDILKEITGIEIIDNFYSIDEFQLNE